MPEDYYGEEGANPRPGPDTAAPNADRPDQDESENQSALIPKALCAGHELDVGDTVTLKIVGVQDSEYLVEYAGNGGEKEEETESESPEMGEPETRTPNKPQRSSRWDEMMD